jgi:hypothetical protein
VSGLPDSGPPSIPGLPDPLGDARRQLALDQIAAQRVSLRAQTQEAERRLEMLAKAPGDSNGAILLVMGELREMGKRLDALATRAAAPTTAPAPIYDQLHQMREGLEAARSIAGETKPPTTEAELAARVAIGRLDMETEERRRKLAFELEDLRASRENDRIRAEAWAEQVRTWLPQLMPVAVQWFQNGGPTGAPAGGEGAPAGVPARDSSRSNGANLVALPGGKAVQPAALGMIEGPCPNCSAPLRYRPTPGNGGDACPRCGTLLAVVEGRIWPKLASGTRSNGGNALPSVAG